MAYDKDGNKATREISVWKIFDRTIEKVKTKKIKFYFKDILDENNYNSSFPWVTPVSLKHPTKIVDSKYPPSLFRINQLYSWFFIYISKLDLDEDIPEEFKSFEILLPHPSRIVESFKYDGDRDLEIKGDVVFNLYFSSTIPSKFQNRDRLKIGLYSFDEKSLVPLPREIKNKTVEIKPDLLGKISRQEIRLKDIDYTLHPETYLLFQVEIIPSNKTIMEIMDKIDIDKISDHLRETVNQWEDSRFSILRNISLLINYTLNFMDEWDISKEDIIELTNIFRSTSIVYDSITHPSSVTVPFLLEEETNGKLKA